MKLVVLALFLLASAASAPAVIIAGDESHSTSAPADDFGFEDIAQVFGVSGNFYSSGVYIGNGWMLSAYHVVHDSSGSGFLFGNVILDGLFYSVDPASAIRLRNSDDSFADLALFRLTTTPIGVTGASVSGTVPANNTQVILAGNGYHRETTQTQWNVNNSTNPPTWTETTGTGDHQGYYWDYTQTIRWGSNNLNSTPVVVDDGAGTTTMVRTSFTAGVDGEAQGAAGDSGGGLFYKNGSNWQLLGITLTVDNFAGQPSTVSPSDIQHDSAVFGNNTYYADLAAYKPQIDAVVPEPGIGTLFVTCAGLMLGTARRRK